jgi:hypothetical protein
MRSRSSALHRQDYNGSATIRDSSNGGLSLKNATERPKSTLGQKAPVLAPTGRVFEVHFAGEPPRVLEGEAFAKRLTGRAE